MLLSLELLGQSIPFAFCVFARISFSAPLFGFTFDLKWGVVIGTNQGTTGRFVVGVITTNTGIIGRIPTATGVGFKERAE